MTASSPGDRAATSEVPAADRWTPATRPPGHPATRPPGHPATRPPGHPATRPPGRRPRRRVPHDRHMAEPDTAPQLGTLSWLPTHLHLDLLGESVAAAVPALTGPVWVAAIDDDVADTAAFTDAYQVPPA